MPLRDLELHGHSHIFYFLFIVLGVDPGRVQQRITDFTGPWDDFMVLGVNNP